MFYLVFFSNHFIKNILKKEKVCYNNFEKMKGEINMGDKPKKEEKTNTPNEPKKKEKNNISNEPKKKEKTNILKEQKNKENVNVANRSKKKVVIICLVVAFLILAICGGLGGYYYFTENKKILEIHNTQKSSLKEFSEEVKYGQEISYDDLLIKLIDKEKIQENTNIIIQINDKELLNGETFKFEQLGTYTVKVKTKYTYVYPVLNFIKQNIEEEKTLEIIIEDKEKPVITGISNKEITVGDNINLQDGITASDNVDGDVEVKLEGSVDNQKAGTYTIKVTATDKSGNTEEATFTVTVKEKPKVASTTTSGNKKTNSGTSSGNKNSGSSSGTATSSSGSAQQYIQDILRLTNQYRAEVGVPALTLDSKLSSAAQKRATELVSTPSHTRPDGTDCFTVLTEYGINYWACGENIAYGQQNGVSAATWWRNSPGHYGNMTAQKFAKIGIGAYYSGGRWYWVQLFTN